jgi:hypothetical protein
MALMDFIKKQFVIQWTGINDRTAETAVLMAGMPG